jgi:acetyl-CoA acyltransferase
MKEVYIVKGYRSAVGKAKKGSFKNYRPDDLSADIIKQIIKEITEESGGKFNSEMIDDVIVGNAMPEAQQGLNMGRMISLMGLDTIKVPGQIMNRFCASGLETITTAIAKIQAGHADMILAGGAESMSMVPMGGFKPALAYSVVKNGHPDWYWGMGLTAEEVAKEYKISREEQDEFAYESHQRAIRAIKEGKFKNQIVPVEVEEIYYDAKTGKKKSKKIVVDTDEGPRADTTLEKLAKLRPVFAQGGTVTAGNSSQTSDGAAYVMVMSKEKMEELGLKPYARLVDYAVVGVPPRIMGIGPLYAIPKVLEKAGMTKDDMDIIELNEAFASQSVAVIKNLGLDRSKVNPNGGAIALGHPLRMTGAKLTVQVLDELKQTGGRYGMVTMCVGTGQGAAGIFELLDR